MRTIACLIGVGLLLGCDSNDNYLGSANSKVVDDRVEFELFGEPGLEATIPGLPPVTLPVPAGTKLSLPLDQFPDGDNVVDIKLSKGGKTVNVRTSFTKVPGAAAPFVRLVDCSSGGSGSEAAAVTSPLGNIEYCWLHDDGTIHLNLVASQAGALTIDGAPVAVGKDGKASYTIDLDVSVLKAPIAAAVGDGSGVAGPTLAVALSRDGKVLVEGKAEVGLGRTVGKRTRALLVGVGKGELLPRGDGAPAVEPKSLVFAPAVEYSALVHVGRVSTVGAVGKVAIARDQEGRDGGECGPYGSTGSEPGPGDATPPRKLVDVEVTVYDAVTGDELGKRVFADDHEDCPLFLMSTGGKFDTVESRPENKAILRWLEGVARS